MAVIIDDFSIDVTEPERRIDVAPTMSAAPTVQPADLARLLFHEARRHARLRAD